MKLGVLPLVLALSVNPSAAPQPVAVDRVENTIFVGDSRFNGMNMYTGKATGYLVAKDSMGYTWLTRTATYEVDHIKAAHPEVDNWTVVVNLGVNDLYNADRYISFYKQMMTDGTRVIAMSVNPTNRKRNSLNKEIDDFNDKLEESGLEYFDMCSHLREVGFDTVDGLHYNRDTNIEIWNELNNYIAYEEDTSNASEDNTDNATVVEFDGWLCGRSGAGTV